MATKRDLSIAALVKCLAAENIAVCITLPNGTTIQTLTPAGITSPMSAHDNEAPVEYGAFAKKVR